MYLRHGSTEAAAMAVDLAQLSGEIASVTRETDVAQAFAERGRRSCPTSSSVSMRRAQALRPSFAVDQDHSVTEASFVAFDTS